MKLVVSRGGEPWAGVNSTVRILMFFSGMFLLTVFNLSVISAGVVLLVCTALGICSRLYRGGKNLRVPVIGLRIAAAISLVLLYLPPVVLFGFSRVPSLYAGKRFVYLHGVADCPENRLLLPEKLPSGITDYYLFTQGIFINIFTGHSPLPKGEITMSKAPVALLIMDGFGINPDSYGNAIKAAKTPNLDKYFASWPNTIIGASGLDVGLPDGQMGNSEVGHTNMGAGRIVYQQLVKITKSIQDGDFFENKALKAAMQNARDKGTALHLMGLLSPGGVHSHMTHLYGLVEMAKRFGLEKVYVHAFLDGRDVPPSSAAEYMEEAVAELKKIGVGEIGVISGRFYAMDRDNAWDRVEKAYDALVLGEGVQETDPVQAIKNSYENGVTDEFMIPAVVSKNAKISGNDSVIFFNFRPDRARQITRAFVDPDFKGFERKKGFFPVHFVCMAQYDATMPNVSVAFPPEELTMTLGEVLAKSGKTQLRIAETQKYAHVTFFFNGGEEKQFEGEERILIKSPDVETFDLKPDMSAYEVTEAVLKEIAADKFDAIILNFANCDMVGHTGVFDAAVQAVEAVDDCVGQVTEAILAKGGKVLITADHGNADKMKEPDGSPFTAHTTNPVPVIMVGDDRPLRSGGVLADLAPTVLELMNIPQPAEMTASSLIAK